MNPAEGGPVAQRERTASDPVFWLHRLARAGVPDAERELAEAARAWPDDPVLAWWRTWLPRHADVLAHPPDVTEVPDRVRVMAPTLYAWLIADPQRPPAVDPGLLRPYMAVPHLAVRHGLPVPPPALVRVLPEGVRAVTAVAWLPGTTRLAVAGSSGLLRIREAQTGVAVATLVGHTDTVHSVRWSPDGTRLVTTGEDGTVRLRDTATGALSGTLAGLASAVAWSPDGTRLATAGRDATVRVWDATTGAEIAALGGTLNLVHEVVWSPDGLRLATADGHRTVRIWDLKTGAVETRTGHTDAVRSVSWSPDGSRIASGGMDGKVWLWSTGGEGPTTGEPVVLSGHTRGIRSVAWSPDGERVVTGAEDHTVRIWDVSTGAAGVLTGHSEQVVAVAWSGDGTRVASASWDGTARIWDPARVTADVPPVDLVSAVALAPDGSRLATVDDDRVARLRDPVGGAVSATLGTVASPGGPIAWSPDGTRLAVAAAAKVRIWDTASGAAGPLVPYPGSVRGLTWSPDSRKLAVSAGDGRVRIRSGVDVTRDVERITVRDGPLGRVAWSPDGTHLAIVGGHRTVQIWELDKTWLTRRPIVRLAGAYLVRDVAWSPAGGRLAAIDADGMLWLWDVGNPDAVAGQPTGGRPAIGMVWSPDGGLIAVARPDGAVSIHHPETLAELSRVQLGAPARIDWAGPHLVAVVSGAVVALRVAGR